MPNKNEMMGGVTQYERDNLSDESKRTLDRVAGGVPMTDDETKRIAGELKSMRGRDMFDSSSLQNALQKIKNGR